MPVYHPLENKIVTREQFLSKAPERPPSFDLRRAVASKNARDFANVGFGKPMSIVLRRVYTGQYPQKHFLNNSKPMLLNSAIKDINSTGAGTRALNVLKQHVGPGSSFTGPSATEEGTTLLYYSPAVTSAQITVTIDLIFEDFDSALFSVTSQLFSNLSGIPIFQPASAYLMGASTVIKLASDVGQTMFNGKPVMHQDLPLDFSIGGGAIPVPGFWIFSEHSIDLSGYSFDPIDGLISNASQKPYDGQEPFVAVSIDGNKQDGLSSFKPLLVTASILAQFYNQKDGTAVATDSILSGVKLVNDLEYRRKAEDIKQRLSSEQPGTQQYSSLKSQLDAFLANIGEPALKLPG